jgi:glycosyltransferase involved in cell wall biosynthesis
MAPPLVSCILATRDRKPFLQQAIKYFCRQEYPHKELIIVDDSATAAVDIVPHDMRIRYIRLDEQTPLGRKLNLGIAASSGALLQKLDDDDYYHADFLTTTVTALQGADPQQAIVGLDCFLVLIAATGELKFSGHGWCAGGTLCFSRQLWEQGPFREVPRAVDWWFLQDHASQHVKICRPELYVLVRHHAGHLWTRLGTQGVTAYFRQRPTYAVSLARYMPVDDYVFYKHLRTMP